MQAHVGRRLGEQRLGVALLHRRRRIVPLARAFERIAAGLDLALDVAGLAGNAGDLLEPVVMRLQFVLNLVTFRHDAGAVALDHVAADAKVVGQEAPGLAVPVQAGAADAVARQEAAPFADRQRGLRGVVAHGQRFLLRTQEDVVTHRIAQLVGGGADVEIAGGVAPRTALQRDDIQSKAGQFIGDDRAGPAKPDDDDILARKTAGHQRSPQAGRPCKLTGGSV